jgi:soluble lytic murein transglycosylase-like protein
MATDPALFDKTRHSGAGRNPVGWTPACAGVTGSGVFRAPVRLSFALGLLCTLLFFTVTPAWAGAQQYEPLAASVQAALHAAVADQAAPEPRFDSIEEKIDWLAEMSRRLEKRMPDRRARHEFLKAVHYEAQRAGLDPQLVLGLIQVESGFRKHAVSSAGARGYMQVMPFWVKLIGKPDHNLFHLRSNLRFGCTILRHYLDIEKGDLFRALGRYNGSLGRPEYPNLVRATWEKQWGWEPQRLATR